MVRAINYDPSLGLILLIAFSRYWPLRKKEIQGPGHKTLNDQCRENKAVHCAVVAGTLKGTDFKGFSADLRFMEKLKKPNGLGQPVKPTVEEFPGTIKDKTSLKFMGKVKSVDYTTICNKGIYNSLHS